MKRFNLTPKLTLVFALFAGVLLLGLTIPAYLRGRESLRTASFSELEATALEKEAALDNWIQERQHTLEDIARQTNLRDSLRWFIYADPHSKTADLFYDELVTNLQNWAGAAGYNFSMLSIVQAESGQVIVSTEPSEVGKFKESRPYFINGKLGSTVQNPYYDITLRGPAMTAATPLFSRDGKLLAVLAGSLDLEEMNQIIQRRSGLHVSDDSFLVNSANLPVTQPRLLPDPGVLQRGLNTIAISRCLQGNSDLIEADDYRNIPAVIAYHWLPERQLCLISKIDQQEAYAPVHALGNSMALIGGLVLILGTLAAFFMSRAIVTPVRNLVDGADQIGAGNLAFRIAVNSSDELGTLGMAFNRMAATLQEKESQLRGWAAELEQRVDERTHQLQQSEERYRILAESSPEMIFVIDREDQVQYVNQRAAGQFGKTPDQVIGLPRLDIFPPTVGEGQALGLKKVLETGETLSSESEVIFPTGKVWLETQLVPVRDDSGTVSAVMGISRDISERKRAEQIIREEKALSDSIINSLPGIFYLFDAQGKFLRWNKNYEQVSGYSAEEMLERNPLDFFTGDEKTLVEERIRETFVTGSSQVEANFISRNGQSNPYLLTGLRVMLDGQVYLIGTGIDITERKQAEQIAETRLRILEYAEAHTLDEILQKTLDEVGALVHSPVGFYHFVDADQQNLTLQAWSTRTLEEYCQSDREGLHYPIDQAGVWVDCVRERRAVIHNDYASLAHRKGLPAGHASLTRELVVPVFRKNTIVAILGVGNKPRNYTEAEADLVTFFADLAWTIAESKQVKQNLQKANEDLTRSNSELERFAYVASHDLQEPLRMVTSYLQLLERRYKPSLDGDALEFINYAVDGSNRMKTLINDLLAYSRVGTRSKEYKPVDLEAVLGQVLRIYQTSVEETHAQITHDPLPVVMGDEGQLEQLFQNLVGNAIKFHGDEAPQVHIGVKKESQNWLFSVRDNGIGIDPQFYERIFIIFQRLHNREEYAGTGIGLAISKRIVEKHGGRIWIESEPGKGSTFYFTIPNKGQEG